MRLLSSIAAGLLLLTAIPAVAQPARPAPPAKPVVIPLEPYLGVLWSFEAQAGGKPHRFLLDTAGGITVITPGFARAAGCEPWGQITGFRMRGDRVDTQRCDHIAVDVAGLPLASPSVGVFDFSKLLPKNAPPLDGSVALDAFAGRAVTLDIAGRRLVVETPASLKARIRRGVEVPVRFARDAGGLALTPLIAATTAKGPVWMELDCGSDGAVVVGRHNAALLGLDPDASGAQTLEMTVQGGPRASAKAVVQDLILDGNIGVAVLKSWVVTLDLAQERAWIAPAGK